MAPKRSKSIVDTPKAKKMWDYSRNTLDPSVISAKSHKYAFFVCPECNNSWQGIIRDAINHGMCPDCIKRKNIAARRSRAIETGNSLRDSFPDIASQWVAEINDELDLSPESVSAYSNHKVSWKCPKCHNIYKAIIVNRTKRHSACPFCSGQQVAVGYNDLASQRPDLLAEWDYEQNNTERIFPTEVTCGSRKAANWICPLGHKYKRAIKDRTSGKNCSVCGKASQTSFPEQALFFYIKQFFGNAQNRYKYDGRYEIDIYIPECSTGIEYDGLYYHTDKKKESDKRKEAYLVSHGVHLIRIKEDEDASFCIDNDLITTPIDASYKYMNRVIEVILKKLGITPPPVNLKNNFGEIYAQYIYIQQENSVYQNPSLLAGWDYEGNGAVKPEAVSQNSNHPVSWICAKGHSYLASPKHRNAGTNCPYCAGKKVLAGYNDFLSYSKLHPEILTNWDYNNNPKNLNEIFFSSTKAFQWICAKCGRQYQKNLRDAIRGEGCPYCNHKLVATEMSFGILHPEALLDWDYERNDVDPNTLAEFSNRYVYWKCHICGSRTKATVNSRAKGFRCARCAVVTTREKSGRTRIKNRGSLASNKPLLLLEWDYQKNDIDPENVTSGSGQKVWWKCSNCSAQWEDTINSRSHGKKCPSCGFSPYPKPRKEVTEEAKLAHQRKVQQHAAITIVQQRGSLKDNKPLLADEWNVDKNANLPFSASEVTTGSKKSVWWKCSRCQFEWEDTIQARSNGKRCPSCSFTPYPKARQK